MADSSVRKRFSAGWRRFYSRFRIDHGPKGMFDIHPYSKSVYSTTVLNAEIALLPEDHFQRAEFESRLDSILEVFILVLENKCETLAAVAAAIERLEEEVGSARRESVYGPSH